MNARRIGLIAALSFAVIATSAITSGVIAHQSTVKPQTNSTEDASPFALVSNRTALTPTDFTVAAERTIESVVHVKVKIQMNPQSIGGGSIFDFFFGFPGERGMAPREQEGAGSGVILSSDGYIVTNNHVIDQATSVEVTLNDKRTFEAKIVGTDPSTDLALLKIEASDLHPIVIGNSDDLHVGEWVLAVGNPFNLTSTVTAGIVSAKARNINIISGDMKIESFIQTDAAVNPGNSGGALVNTDGELVGINTAIASQTGNYSGYSFAIPATIMSKVVSDLKEYKMVQRAVLGIHFTDIDNKLAQEKGLKRLNGVYVISVAENSSASDAGLKEGDVIIAINSVATNSSAELQEQIGRHRPGDEVTISYVRDGKQADKTIRLKNRSGNTNIIKPTDNLALGVTFKSVDPRLADYFDLAAGIQIAKINNDGLFAKGGIKKDFIILKINGQIIHSEYDINEIVDKTSKAGDQDQVLFITGIYPSGKVYHYAISLK